MPFWRVFLATRTSCILLQGSVDIFHSVKHTMMNSITQEKQLPNQSLKINVQFSGTNTRCMVPAWQVTIPLPIFSPSGREAHALDIHVPSNEDHHHPSLPKVQKLLPPFPTRVEVFLVHLFSKTKSFPVIKSDPIS